MSSEKIIMGDSPSPGGKSKKGGLIFILAAIIVIVVLIFIIKPFTLKSSEPEIKVVEEPLEQVTEEAVVDSQEPVAEESSSVTTDTTESVEIVEEPVKAPPPVPPAIPPHRTIIHIVQKGECLWTIAEYEYDDPFKWTIIYNANEDKITNPDLIYPNQEFQIPKNHK